MICWIYNKQLDCPIQESLENEKALVGGLSSGTFRIGSFLKL